MQLTNTLLWPFMMLIASFNTPMAMNIRPTTSTNIELAQSNITANPPIGCLQFLQQNETKKDYPNDYLNKKFCSFNPNFKKDEYNSHSTFISQNKNINKNGFLLYTFHKITKDDKYNNYNSLIDKKDKETSLNNIEKYANETLTELISIKTDLEAGFKTLKGKYTNNDQITNCITLESQENQKSIPEEYITQIVNPMKKLYLYREQEINNIKTIIENFDISDFTKNYIESKWDNIIDKITYAIHHFIESDNDFHYVYTDEYNKPKLDKCIDNRFLNEVSQKVNNNKFALFSFYNDNLLCGKKKISYDNTTGIITSDSFKTFKQAHYNFLNSYIFYLHSRVCFVEGALLAYSENSKGIKSLFYKVKLVIKNDIDYLNNSISMLEYILKSVENDNLQEKSTTLGPQQEFSLASDASSITPVGFIGALLSIAIARMNNRHV